MSDDKIEQLRQWLEGLSTEELQDVLGSILDGDRPGVAAAASPHTPAVPELPDPPDEPRALTVRVDVDATKPPVWRRLVVRGDLFLDEVHDVLQAAFGWENYHLHTFWPGPTKQVWGGPSFVTEQDVAEGETGVLEAEVRLDQLLRNRGDRIFYTYDFGDNWTHTIKLESSALLDPDSPHAVCTGGRMAGPLEDAGGPHGHNELVKAYLADASMPGLDAYQRDWLPPGWDPTEVDFDAVTRRLELVGLTTEELLDGLSGVDQTGGPGVGPVPKSLGSLLELATPTVLASLAMLSRRARNDVDAELSPEDMTAVAQPYRYLVELAGDEGIPLTAAGWMRPSYVERVYRDLGLDSDWIGKGNREDQTLPVAQLRRSCQEIGLLRKHKGRLLATRLAQSLTTDEEYVEALAGRLLQHRDEHLEAALTLFALLTASTGRPDLEHAGEIARIMTSCGLRTGPDGVDPRHVGEWVWPLWFTLRHAAGERHLDHDADVQSHRAVALARAALWPDG